MKKDSQPDSEENGGIKERRRGNGLGFKELGYARYFRYGTRHKACCAAR